MTADTRRDRVVKAIAAKMSFDWHDFAEELADVALEAADGAALDPQAFLETVELMDAMPDWSVVKIDGETLYERLPSGGWARLTPARTVVDSGTLLCFRPKVVRLP